MMPEWLVIVLFFYGIALGLYIGWCLWRRPNLNYVDDDK